jgi:hypothetical protein
MELGNEIRDLLLGEVHLEREGHFGKSVRQRFVPLTRNIVGYIKLVDGGVPDR